jgi:hypothetical protein
VSVAGSWKCWLIASPAGFRPIPIPEDRVHAAIGGCYYRETPGLVSLYIGIYTRAGAACTVHLCTEHAGCSEGPPKKNRRAPPYI